MSPEPPYSLVAELTYACPLRCAYCSNPTSGMPAHTLDTAAWLEVLEQAAALGVMHVAFTGGEPLLRDDLETLIARASELDVYTFLVTSGLPLERERLERLAAAGLDAVQLSFQDTDAAAARAVAGRDALAHKRKVAGWVRDLGLPLTMNVVLHAQNLPRLPQLLALARELEPDRLELANVQWLGWALENRDALLPTTRQIHVARRLAAEAKEALRGRTEVVFVSPDYLAGRPRACMGGWGKRTMVVTPDGLITACHAARDLPGLDWPRAGRQSLADAWRSAAFEAYRGNAWLPAPCSSCDRRELDFGGCRCQAYALTGDPGTSDPACERSPHRHLVDAAVARAGQGVAPSLRKLKVVP